MKNVLDFFNRQNATHWFVTGMGLVYFVAIFPVIFQYEALIGENGLSPASELIKLGYEQEGIFALLRFPSLYWIYPSDTTIFIILILGCISSTLLIVRKYIVVASITAFISFTSLCTIGGDFFVIIIDLFLSECGFLLMLVAYSYFKHDKIQKHIILLGHLILFKLWLGMGGVKFGGLDSSWSNFTFFDHFYGNQPMPTPLAWYMDKSPSFFGYVGIVFTWIVEMILPFFIFFKRLRKIAFFGFLVMSIGILILGNYGYFNWLSIVLSFVLLIPESQIKDSNYLKSPRVAIWFLPLAFLNIYYTATSFSPWKENPQHQFNFINYHTDKYTLTKPLGIISYFRICNPYGVFKDIPQKRIELVFSGSNDGINWKQYEFNYFPSSKTQNLRFFAPYYPRLDHLLYYETLNAGSYNFNILNPHYTKENPWVCRFVSSIFSNNKTVLNQLKMDPFEGRSPKYLKVEANFLEFTTTEEHSKTGKVWKSVKRVELFTQTAGDEVRCQPLISNEWLMQNFN